MAWLSEISWVMPWVFWLLPMPVLVYYFLPARQPAPIRALRVPDRSRYESLTTHQMRNGGRQWARMSLLAIAWCALLVATARPQTFGEPMGVPVSGRDLMLCIDISGSMREADLYAGNTRATRMAVVKQVAKDFVARRAGDRIGLVMFGSQAYLQTPLTRDHRTVQHFLSEAAVGLAGRSTAIGDAIGLAVKRLRDRPDAARVIILLTDGENSAGVIEPLQAAQLAEQHSIRIHAIGVGADAQTSVFNAPFGGPRSELDEATLRAISDATGGQYFRARNQKELANIYREIDRLEPTDEEGNEFRPLTELFFWPLSVALLCSMLWALMAILPSSLRRSGKAS